MKSNIKKNQYTRSVTLSSSLHFSELSDYRAAGNGEPVLEGQTGVGLDNGYGLQGNPTLHSLQDSISHLEKGKFTLLYPSGLTALIALSALLEKGDHWLLPDSVYCPLRRFADDLRDRFGIVYDLYNPTDVRSVKNVLTEKTKLIHIETPSSVTFDVTDVEGIINLAKSRKILTSADNTWASGILYQPLVHGVDITILSLSKYAAGYSDVFMGSVTTKNTALYKKLAYHHRVYGYTVSPFSAMLVARGLESLQVRLVQEAKNAKTIIDAIKHHKKISRIYSIDSAKHRDFSGSNSLFSVELDRVYTDRELEKACLSLTTYTIGESWGGTRSLVLPFQPGEFAKRLSPPKNTILRFHAGLDDVSKQITDIQTLLKVL